MPKPCSRTWPFPSADPAALVRDAVTLAVQVNGKLRGTIEVAVERAARGRSRRSRWPKPNVAKVPRRPDGAERSSWCPGKIVNIVAA